MKNKLITIPEELFFVLQRYKREFEKIEGQSLSMNSVINRMLMSNMRPMSHEDVEMFKREYERAPRILINGEAIRRE